MIQFPVHDAKVPCPDGNACCKQHYPKNFRDQTLATETDGMLPLRIGEAPRKRTKSEQEICPMERKTHTLVP